MGLARTKGDRWVISTKDETRQAIVDIVNEASWKLSICTRDLEVGVYDHPDFLQALTQLVLSQTYVRIRILIATPPSSIKYDNAFIELGRRLRGYIEFRHLPEELWADAETFCLADDFGVAYRLREDSWNGIVDTYEPPVAKLYGDLFTNLWAKSDTTSDLPHLSIHEASELGYQ